MRRWRGAAASVVAVLILVAGACGVLLGVHIEAVAMPAAALGAGVLTAVTLTRAVRHARLARMLALTSWPGLLAGEPVRTVPGLGPMVAGLLRPQVYCGDDIPARLSPREQQAVLLHERYHQQRRDPVRLVFFEATHRCLGWIPAVQRWVNDARARLEIRADAYALARGASRPDLARALLTLADAAPPAGAGFATVTEQRLAALLGDQPPRRRHPFRSGLLGLALVALMAAACTPLSAASHPELSFAARCLAGACGGGG